MRTKMNKRIRTLKNTSQEKIFILGNGPSIVNHDLGKLVGHDVIGMNASTLLEGEYGFVSKYYVVSDERFLTHPEKQKYASEELNENTIRVFRSELQFVEKNVVSNDTLYVNSIGKNGFSKNLAHGYYFGCTTAMLAIQLAYHVGAKKIYLLGNDFRYSKEQPRFYAEKIPQSNDNFLSVQLWNIRNAYCELVKEGVEMYNCSSNSNLASYIPYANFDEVTE